MFHSSYRLSVFMLCLCCVYVVFMLCQETETKISASDHDRSKNQTSNSPGLKSKLRYRLGGSPGSFGPNEAESTPSPNASHQTTSSKSAHRLANTNNANSSRSSIRQPIPTRNLTFNFSRLSRRGVLNTRDDVSGLRRQRPDQLVITQSSVLSFVDFVDLFRAFALRMRKDLRDLFEQQATVGQLCTVDQLIAGDQINGVQCSTFPSCHVNGLYYDLLPKWFCTILS